MTYTVCVVLSNVTQSQEAAAASVAAAVADAEQARHLQQELQQQYTELSARATEQVRSHYSYMLSLYLM
jgi:hypothetical protein